MNFSRVKSKKRSQRFATSQKYFLKCHVHMGAENPQKIDKKEEKNAKSLFVT